MRLSVKDNLKKYLPSIFLLLDDNPIKWNRIDNLFQNRYEKLKEKFESQDEPIIKESTFFDFINSALNNDQHALIFLSFMDGLFLELNETLDKKEKKLVKQQIFGILTNHDKNFLNYIGELAVLKKMKKSGGIKLLASELPLDPDKPKGPSGDFYFELEKLDTEAILEVLNIHVWRYETLDKLERKIVQEVDEKFSSKKGSRPIIIAPILWCFEKQSNILNEAKFKIESLYNECMPLLCYRSAIDSKGQLIHYFGPLETVP